MKRAKGLPPSTKSVRRIGLSKGDQKFGYDSATQTSATQTFFGVISLCLPKRWRGLIRFDPVTTIEVDSLSAISIFKSDAHRRGKMLLNRIGLCVP